MRVSYRWLKELLPALEAPADEVGDRLTAAGLEVEELIYAGDELGSVKIAEVVGVEAHPKRDKLSLVTVSLGDSGAHRVVCGASNVPAPGGLVVLATVGASLPAFGRPLEARQIGGVDSAGMLCSEAELGLADASEGILVFPPKSARPGDSLSAAFPDAVDRIFEIGVTPNRPDALGHIGIAREVAALLGLPFELPEPGAPRRMTDTALASVIRVDVEEPERCPLYGAALVEDVALGPSPTWLRWRLHRLGIRPISNVVDITNLLLMEYGQPMHAFDCDLVRGGRIVVRRAHHQEPFTTLDGVERKLSSDDLVICDDKGPVALAGVMGGENSEIRSSTRRVLLECAYFHPAGIRRTSRRHGLSTESSYRFERGVDWARVPQVLDRAKTLLTELSHGSATDGALLVRGAPLTTARATMRSSRLGALLGTAVPFEEATATLDRLGLRVVETRGDDDDRVAEVEGASFRPDVTREVDLIEEVARVRGFDAIPTILPAIVPQEPRARPLSSIVTDIAVELGLSEAVTYSFVSERDLELIGAPPPVVTLENPLSEERRVMRTSLLPGLLDALGRARRRGEHHARLFTVGARFLTPQADASEGSPLPEERPSFAAILAGPRPAYLQKPEDYDVFDAKGLAVELVERMTSKKAVARRTDRAEAGHLHPRGRAEVEVDGHIVGLFGPLHPDVVDALDLDGPAQVVELDLAALGAVGHVTPQYRPIPRLPAVQRDIAVVVSEDVPAARLEQRLAEEAGDLCESVELFDVFSGETMGAGRRSLAFRLTYRDPKAATDPDNARTLTDKEVDACHERVRAIASELGDLRG